MSWRKIVGRTLREERKDVRYDLGSGDLIKFRIINECD